MVKVLHVSAYCHAASVGGTERYLLELIRGLARQGYESAIAWLTTDAAAEACEADGVRVLPLPCAPMRTDPPPDGLAAAAARLLDSERPALLHFHTFGLGEALVARGALARGIPYAFTYHSPAWTCRRGTMFLWGRTPCDGEVRAFRCGACRLHAQTGGPPALAYAAAWGSALTGWVGLALGGSWRRRTAFTWETAHFGRELREFLAGCGLVVSCCEWSRPVLRLNGARAECVCSCPQGLPRGFVSAAGAVAGERGAFTVGYVGRVTEVKGVDILLGGFRAADLPEARLRIFGCGTGEPAYEQRIRALADGDRRIELHPVVPFERSGEAYRGLSLLALPCVWMETGPLTLFEAFSLGIPVWASNRVGQLAMLRERGRVVEPNTVESWSRALAEAHASFLAGSWEKERARARGDGRVRTMDDVAGEMAARYTRLTAASDEKVARDPVCRPG